MDVKPDDVKKHRLGAYNGILAYLAEHPHAQDTVEGIFEWWLLENELAFRLNEIEAALAQLVSQGFLIERKGFGSAVVYQLNRSKYKQIRSIADQYTGEKEVVCKTCAG
jgi:hypothetical protein